MHALANERYPCALQLMIRGIRGVIQKSAISDEPFASRAHIRANKFRNHQPSNLVDSSYRILVNAKLSPESHHLSNGIGGANSVTRLILLS